LEEEEKGLRDDVQIVTLEWALIVAPPLELWTQVVGLCCKNESGPVNLSLF
jgi:hypothetical protein